MSDPRPGDLAAEREFAFRSLADLEREHQAGDVDDADYEALRSSYVEHAAAVLRAISRDEDRAVTPRKGRLNGWRRVRRALGRRRTRRVLGIASVVVLVLGLGLFAAELAGVRLPGEDATGTITLPQETLVGEQLAEASIAANTGHLEEAVETYDAVLSEEPNEKTALTYSGWLVRLSGIAARRPATVADGDASLARAVAMYPGYPDARALDGIALAEDHSDLNGAMRQFRAFFADHPSETLLKDVRPQLVKVYQRAGDPLPSALQRHATPSSTKS